MATVTVKTCETIGFSSSHPLIPLLHLLLFVRALHRFNLFGIRLLVIIYQFKATVVQVKNVDYGIMMDKANIL